MILRRKILLIPITSCCGACAEVNSSALLAELRERSLGEGLGIAEPDDFGFVIHYFDSTTLRRRLPETRYWTVCRSELMLGQTARGLVVANGTDRRILGRSAARVVNAWPAALSPGGRSLAFVGTDLTSNVTGLQYGALDAIRFKVVYRLDHWPPEPNEHVGSIDWSPDGRAFVYCRAGEVYVYDLERGSRSFAAGTNPTWSPCGEWIAYRSRAGEVELQDVNSRKTRRLLPGRRVLFGLHWSRDGRYVFFSERRMLTVRFVVYRMADGAAACVFEHAFGPDDRAFEWMRLKVSPGSRDERAE